MSKPYLNANWHLTLLTLICILTLSQATSIARQRPLTHVSPVNWVSIDTPDGYIPDLTGSDTEAKTKLSITLKLPSSRRYQHIQRRWWAIADPNNANKLQSIKLNHSKPFIGAGESLDAPGIASEKLFAYLTRNNTGYLEYPENELEFKFILEPNVHLADVPVNILSSGGADGETQIPLEGFWKRSLDHTAALPLPLHGQAYRKKMSYDIRTGNTKSTWVNVGWARLTVYQDGESPLLSGAWKVDDEANLGVPSSIYHIATTRTAQRTLGRYFDSEKELLAGIDSDMLVYRDADLRANQYGIYNDEGYESILADLGIVSKDENDLEPRSSFSDAPDSRFMDLVQRSSSSNDTGNSGFSSGSNLASTIGDTSGCPKPRQISLMGIAGDCNFLSQFNTSSEASSHIITAVNSASQAFEVAFNITLGLKEIVLVNSSSCPAANSSSSEDSSQKWNYACSSSSDMSERLSLFSQWRGERSDDGLATWSMFTDCAEGGVVGLSWLGMACRSTASNDVSGTNVVSHTDLDWRVLAHELGHSFGAVHDCEADTCSQGLDSTSGCCPLTSSSCNANGKYLMNPSASESEDGFSPCTQGNVCSAIGKNSVNTTCLTSNTGVSLVTENECGNGIVEDGEECDCGGEDGCAGNTCCDPKTCKLTSGSQCDDSNDSCCSGCKLASSDTICRASQGSCDPPEYCTGNSTICPSDKTSADGTSCSSNSTSLDGLTCASGQCTSRDLQCITLLSNTTLVVDGDALNITRACDDDTSCQLSCVDSRYGSVCFSVSQNFLDGTPCKGTGKCKGGVCIGGKSSGSSSGGGSDTYTPLGLNDGWFSRHKGIVIGVICGVGALVIGWLVAGYIRRHYMQQKMITDYKSRHQMTASSSDAGYPTVPQTAYYGGWRGNGEAMEMNPYSSNYSGYNNGSTPYAPPMNFSRNHY